MKQLFKRNFLMKYFDVENVYEVRRPFATLAKAFGFSTFTIIDDDKNNVRIVITVRDKICLFFAIFVYLYILYKQLSLKAPSFLQNSMILHSGINLLTSTSIGVAILTMFFIVYHREKIGDILRHFYEFDQKIAEMGIKINHRAHKMYIVGHAILSAIAVFALTLVSTLMVLTYSKKFNIDTDWVLSILRTWSIAAYAVQMSQFSHFILGLKVRYTALNECFCLYFPTQRLHPKLRETTNFQLLQIIKDISILHDKLNDNVERFNFCFSMQIMFAIGLNFAFTVFISFGIFVIISYYNDTFVMVFSSISWLAFYFVFVFKIIGLGSATTREGKRIAVLIHKTINFDQNKFLLDSLYTFSQQQLNQFPVLTCGLFNFDWTLLFTIIGANATYLIILIQFHIANHKPINSPNATYATTETTVY